MKLPANAWCRCKHARDAHKRPDGPCTAGNYKGETWVKCRCRAFDYTPMPHQPGYEEWARRKMLREQEAKTAR